MLYFPKNFSSEHSQMYMDSTGCEVSPSAFAPLWLETCAVKNNNSTRTRYCCILSQPNNKTYDRSYERMAKSSFCILPHLLPCCCVSVESREKEQTALLAEHCWKYVGWDFNLDFWKFKIHTKIEYLIEPTSHKTTNWCNQEYIDRSFMEFVVFVDTGSINVHGSIFVQTGYQFPNYYLNR